MCGSDKISGLQYKSGLLIKTVPRKPPGAKVR